jgi:mRNA-degrading endonuclease YafQ of YafQ-DinJ toxin-antitoxin module
LKSISKIFLKNNKYSIESTKLFDKNFKKLAQNNKILENKIYKTLGLISIDPFYPGLKTHLANTKLFDKKFSSRVDGDIRIIWEFKDSKTIILLLAIDTHDVYK